MADDVSSGGGLDYDHQNEVPGNKRKGQWYAIEQGNGGQWHIYKDGVREFVANVAVASTDGGATAPASTVPIVASTPVSTGTANNTSQAAINATTGGAVAPSSTTSSASGSFGGELPASAADMENQAEQQAAALQHKTAVALEGGGAPTPTSTASPAVVGSASGSFGGELPASAANMENQAEQQAAALQHKTAVALEGGGAPSTSTTTTLHGGSGSASGPIGGELPASGANMDKEAEKQAAAERQHKTAVALEGEGSSSTLNITHPMVNGEAGHSRSTNDSSTVHISHPMMAGGLGQPLSGAPETPSSTPETNHASENTVKVKLGDTLSGIAAANGLSLAQIEALNPSFSSNFNLIRPGDTVKLGGSASGSFGGELPASATNLENQAEQQAAALQHKTAVALEGGGTTSGSASGSFGGELPASAASMDKQAEQQAAALQHKTAEALEGGGSPANLTSSSASAMEAFHKEEATAANPPAHSKWTGLSGNTPKEGTSTVLETFGGALTEPPVAPESGSTTSSTSSSTGNKLTKFKFW